MKALKDRILRDGRCFPGGILKVDNFINHQMDPILMKSIGVEFVRRFASTPINKVITVEASGIAPAIMVGYLLELPVVFAKRKAQYDGEYADYFSFFVYQTTYIRCLCQSRFSLPRRQSAVY